MKRAISTAGAPSAIGPYSQAIQAAGLLFVSGQIALDPATGDLVGASAEAQTAQVLANLDAVLKAAGSGLEDVVKTTIYLVDLSDFAAVNQVYGGAFQEGPPPARATVEVGGLPRGALVEIEAIAVIDDGA